MNDFDGLFCEVSELSKSVKKTLKNIRSIPPEAEALEINQSEDIPMCALKCDKKDAKIIAELVGNMKEVARTFDQESNIKDLDLNGVENFLKNARAFNASNVELLNNIKIMLLGTKKIATKISKTEAATTLAFNHEIAGTSTTVNHEIAATSSPFVNKKTVT